MIPGTRLPAYVGRRHPLEGWRPVLALLAALLAGGCSEDTPRPGQPDSGDEATLTNTEAVVVEDASGRTVRLDGPARRIVSLVPSVTQTLKEMGADDRLVGRTDFDTAEWAQGLPSVGGGLEPNLEAIVALRPDLVVRFAGSQDRRTPARLDDLGIPHVAVRPDRVADVLQAIRMVGSSTGLEEEAEGLAARIMEGLDDVGRRVERLPRRRVAYVLGGTPPWVAGPGTYIHELVAIAGGDNVFADLDDLYAAVSPEEVRSRDIEIVLVSGVDAFDPSLAPEARIEVVDASIEIPGPGLADAALRLAELIHGPLHSPAPAAGGARDPS